MASEKWAQGKAKIQGSLLWTLLWEAPLETNPRCWSLYYHLQPTCSNISMVNSCGNQWNILEAPNLGLLRDVTCFSLNLASGVWPRELVLLSGWLLLAKRSAGSYSQGSDLIAGSWLGCHGRSTSMSLRHKDTCTWGRTQQQYLYPAREQNSVRRVHWYNWTSKSFHTASMQRCTSAEVRGHWELRKIWEMRPSFPFECCQAFREAEK